MIMAKKRWIMGITMSASLLVGCGVMAKVKSTAASPSTTSPAPRRSVAQKVLAQVPLVRRLQISLEQGWLIVRVQLPRGGQSVSRPLLLKAALKNPARHYGTLVGAASQWTLVFGVDPVKAAMVRVDGHSAVQTPTPPTVKPGYTLWEYFLTGDVKHPVIKVQNSP